MRIAILDLTTHTEPLLSGLPNVGIQIENWLSPALPEAAFFSTEVATKNEPLPALSTFDGVVVSGSEYGVYDETPWMEPLREFLRSAKDAGKPIFGICFGHQIMADVFGGKAEKVESGYAVGVRTFDVAGKHVETHVWHQDQVTKIPPGAKVTGMTGYCPVGALDYDFPACSVQFHPEYSEHQLRSLFERGREIFIDGELADEAVKTFEGAKVAADLQSKETAAFFRKHLSG